MPSVQYGNTTHTYGDTDLFPADWTAGEYGFYMHDSPNVTIDLGQVKLFQNALAHGVLDATPSTAVPLGTAGYPEADGTLTYADIKTLRLAANPPYTGDAFRSSKR